MKRLTIAVLSTLFAALPLSAVSLTVSWADGNVERQKGSSWVNVVIGDRIDSTAALRLGKGAFVELNDGKRTMSLTAAGTYMLDTLLKQGAIAARKDVGILDKLGKLVDPKASIGSSAVAVAVVRGEAREPAKDTVDWQSDSVDIAATMDEGRQFVRDGDYENAVLKFGEAASAAEGDDKASAQYAEAWALAANDGTARAVKILRAMPASGRWASPRALLLARLDIDSGAKPEAKSVIDDGIAAKLFAGDDLKLANYLLAESSAK
jgi:hypothetical protein